jgi:hypothetical protein
MFKLITSWAAKTPKAWSSESIASTTMRSQTYTAMLRGCTRERSMNLGRSTEHVQENSWNQVREHPFPSRARVQVHMWTCNDVRKRGQLDKLSHSQTCVANDSVATCMRSLAMTTWPAMGILWTLTQSMCIQHIDTIASILHTVQDPIWWIWFSENVKSLVQIAIRTCDWKMSIRFELVTTREYSMPCS